MKNEKEWVTPQDSDLEKAASKSINDTFVKAYQVGLNDKLAFVKHLFNKETKEYEKVMTQLQTIYSEERSKAFIINLVKPEYNNWEGKEDYEERFMALIARLFA